MSERTLEPLRIQLEGHLEVVEALAAEWATAANTLEADVRLETTSWHRLAEVDARAAAAVTEVEAKSPGLPLLDELVAARQRVATAIRSHATALGIDLPGSKALELMGNLRQLQPIHRLEVVCDQPVPLFSVIKRRHWFAFVTMSVVGISGLVAAWRALPELSVRGLWGLFFPWAGFWLWNSWKRGDKELRSATVQIAGKAIRFPWHSHFQTVSSLTWWRTVRGAHLVFSLGDQPEWVDFDAAPEELLQLLSAAGVPTTEEDFSFKNHPK